MRYLVTGGYGFIGSAFIRNILKIKDTKVLNIDNLTYAANLHNLDLINECDRYTFVKADINDRLTIIDTLKKFKPDVLLHFAAESHVDNSIENATNFITTNINGTFELLEAVRFCLDSFDGLLPKNFRFIHVSTDEVYGDLEIGAQSFTENSRYRPSSPYAASKAASDHLVAAWCRTYKFPAIITNCSNNYGPYQNSEKLIPTVINSIMNNVTIPIYGNGEQIRDWLHVDDHCSALRTISEKGIIGQSYAIGGNCEVSNIKLVHLICDLMDVDCNYRVINRKSSKELIKYVSDRPGHDVRYSISTKKINDELDWTSSTNFIDGLRATIEWYLSNQSTSEGCYQ